MYRPPTIASLAMSTGRSNTLVWKLDIAPVLILLSIGYPLGCVENQGNAGASAPGPASDMQLGPNGGEARSDARYTEIQELVWSVGRVCGDFCHSVVLHLYKAHPISCFEIHKTLKKTV